MGHKTRIWFGGAVAIALMAALLHPLGRSAVATANETMSTEAFSAISAGDSHTCGIRTDESVTCWGDNRLGAASPPTGAFSAITASGHTCGIRTNGSLACWGSHHNHKQYKPPAGSFKTIDAGWGDTCGIRANGSLACWGYYQYREATPPWGSFSDVSVGTHHTCGIRTNGGLACWGKDELGEATPPRGSFIAVDAARNHTCGMRTGATIACWGDVDDGLNKRPAGSFSALSVGEGVTCGIRTDDSLACWGSYGIGYGGGPPTPSGSFRVVSAGFRHACGIRTDGTAECWGNNEYGQSTVPEGPPTPSEEDDCYEPDGDKDGLPDAVETTHSKTNPAKKDTDGDGLWDSWEVSPSVPCGGFNLNDDPTIEAKRGDVFGPYRHTDGQKRFRGDDERVTPQYAQFVRPPDPLHKDVYLEVDWQDCHAGGCPELGFDKYAPSLVDPMHHAPSLNGIELAIEAFDKAPASNPDGTVGVNLHVLIDERIKHEPNCDIDESYARAKFLGTPRHRSGPAMVRAARFVVYRHVWSGHSTVDDSHTEDGTPACKKPSDGAFTKMSFGLKALPAYDYTPFGDALVGGNSILVSLGPAWICPSWIKQINPLRITDWHREPLDDVCFRSLSKTSLGMFPARIILGEETHHLPAPMHYALALTQDSDPTVDHEKKAIAQLWGRSLMHLLGHSLGLENDADIGNDPLADPNIHGTFPVPPTSYDTEWGKLQYAPPSVQNPSAEEPFSPDEECRPFFTNADGEMYRPLAYMTGACY